MMASAALPHQNHQSMQSHQGPTAPHPPPPPDSRLHQRMDQFLSMSAAAGLRPPPTSSAAAPANGSSGNKAAEEMEQNSRYNSPPTSHTPSSAAAGAAPGAGEYPSYRGETTPPHHSLHHVGAGEPYPYQETSITSGSNSGEEDDRELGEGGKRLGGHMNGISSKKRRKQSKPIRLGPGGEPLMSADEGANQSPDGEYRRYSTEDEEGGERASHTESPLNLSSGISSHDQEREPGEKQPSLRILGPELMHQATGGREPGERDPNGKDMPPTSLYSSGMLPFGMPPFPFPFPTSQAQSSMISKSLSLSGSAPITSRSQIFNPEAYCELCNKEFCNKYFLKTHKANKHGIYSDSPGVSRSPGPQQLPPSSGSGGSSTPGPRSDGSEPMHGPPTPNSQSGSPFSGAFIAANMGALRPPFMPLSPGVASHSPSPAGHQNSSKGEIGSANNKDGGNNHREPIRDVPSREGSEHSIPRSPLTRPPMPSPREAMPSPREASELRPEDRERLIQQQREQRDRERENGELRRSLESPRSGMPALPPHLSGLNPLMFGGIPTLESLRKEEELLRKDPKHRPIPNIPNIPNVSSTSMPKGPLTADKLRQMGVINADAFCEICCKEFCNKYFLRVHKLKKHGICSPDLPPEKVQKILNQMAKEAGKTGNPPPHIVRPPVLPGSPEKRSSLPGVSPGGPGGFSSLRPPNLFPLPPSLEPLMPTKPLPSSNSDLSNSEPKASPIPRESHEIEREREREGDVIKISDDSEDGEGLAKDHSKRFAEEQEREGRSNGERSEAGDLQRLQSMIMELNNSKRNADIISAASDNSTICKICNKDMENKYFLRAHMMNEHGVLHVEEPPQLTIGGQPREATPNEQRSREEMDENRESPYPAMNGMSEHEPMDFTAKFLQQMQKGLGMGFPIDGDERSFLERVKNELAGSPQKLNVLGTMLPGMDRDPNRKPASLSRSYCEICKKELCNKYFMKTHMLKMHGINIEAGNSAGVSCNICSKELCSKYFLKVHMQNSHGLNEDGTPLPPGFKENGGMFSSLFPLNGPPPELMGLPGSPDKDHYFSRLLGEQSEISRERLKELQKQKQLLGESGTGGAHVCSLCGEDFPEIVALQVHIIKSHGAFPPDGILRGLDGQPQSSSDKNKTSEEESEVSASEHAQRNSDKENQANNETEKRANTTNDDSSQDNANSNNTQPLSKPDTQKSANSVINALQNSPFPPFPFPGLSELSKGDMAAFADKNFPQIEMLQRQLLTQQIPGLLNPLFPGLPGFPNPFQQLLGGGENVEGAKSNETTPPINKDDEKSQLEGKSSQKGKSKRYKCSKCNLKFPRRDLCLQHIHDNHSIRRKLHFSPHKSRTNRANHNRKVRSQYVRQFMEILKVPTSRGTPQSPSKPDGHIMQPFLLKTPSSNATIENLESSDVIDTENAAAGVTSDDDVAAAAAAAVDKDAFKAGKELNFVPSLVYLPVARRISQPMTVSFSLTPA